MIRVTHSLAALGLVLLLVGVGGCKRAAPRPHVRVIDVVANDLTQRDAPAVGERTVPTADLIASCVAGLRRAGVEVDLQASARPADDFRLRLDVQLENVAPSADTEGRGVLRAMTRGRLQAVGPADLPRLDQDALAEKVYTGTVPADPQWIAHARRAVQDAAEALGAQVHLLESTPQALTDLLVRKDLDPDLRGVAIQLTGLRKQQAAVPALIELLKDNDAQVRDRAIGALIEIGDRRAVKPLAASAPFQDTFELGKILEAVASLGGEEAKSYLSFVAAGHQNEHIREEAKVALSHLEQKEQREQKK